MLSREDAWALMTEYTQSESLRKHMLAVEAAVRGYARLWGEDEEEWGVVALLHDFDYERWPDQANHPFRGVEILKEKGYPEWVTRAILSHAEYSGVPRESRLEHTLFACDEMSGFVTAAALVRPSKSILDLEAASVIKRMKDKAFARAVNRDDLRKGAEEIGLPLDEHITNVIAFMRGRGRRARPQGDVELSEPPFAYKLTTWIRTSRPRRRSPTATSERASRGTRRRRSSQLEGVTVIYGKNQALKNVSARFERGAVGLLGPNGAGKSTMLKALLGFVKPDQGRMRVLGLDVAERPMEIRARLGYMPETDGHIPGMNAVSFVAYCGQLAGLPARRRHAARARSALLRRPRRGAVSQPRDLFDRHEAAHQAGAGDRARSRSAVPRRADQRHGSQGPRRDARAHPRSRPQQERQPDPLVAPAAGRRVHLRSRRRRWTRGRSRRRGRSRS